MKKKTTHNRTSAEITDAEITLLTPDQVSDRLSVGRRTLRRYELQKLLNPIRLSRKIIRFRLDEVQRIAAGV